MGHYCALCYNKIPCGVVPTTCDCFESICEVCWEEMFEDVIIRACRRYVAVDTDGPRCERCSTAYEKDKVREY